MKTVAKPRKSVILRLVLLAFAIYSIVSLGSLQLEMIDKVKKLDELQIEVDAKRAQNQKYLRLLETGTEKDFIERAARDRLGYVYADEEVYTDISGN